MYKVYYYNTGSRFVSSKNFETLAEATKFSISLPRESVLEIKLVTEQKKKENRT